MARCEKEIMRCEKVQITVVIPFIFIAVQEPFFESETNLQIYHKHSGFMAVEILNQSTNVRVH